MRRAIAWVALGVGCYLLFLIATLPAHFLVQQAAPAELRISQVGGTPWRGEARRIEIDSLRLHDVNWRFTPGSLLRGRAGWQLRADLEEGSLRAHVAALPNGGMVVSDALMNWTAQRALAAAGYQGMSGAMTLALDTVALRGEWLSDIEGLLQIREVRIAQLGEHVLGDYSVELEMQGDRVIGHIRDQGGPLELTARIEIHPAPGYLFQGRVRVREGAPAQLVQMISLLGVADPEGWRPFGMEALL